MIMVARKEKDMFAPVFDQEIPYRVNSLKIWQYLVRHRISRTKEMYEMLTVDEYYKKMALFTLKQPLIAQICHKVAKDETIANFYVIHQVRPRTPIATKDDGKLIHQVFRTLKEHHLSAHFVDYFRMDDNHYLSFRDAGFWK